MRCFPIKSLEEKKIMKNSLKVYTQISVFIYEKRNISSYLLNFSISFDVFYVYTETYLNIL